MPHKPPKTRRNLLRGFFKARKGSTAIEFGFIAVPFTMMLLGTLEIALVQLARSSMSHAMEKASREVMTGEAGCKSASEFVEDICSHIKMKNKTNCTNNTKVVLQEIANFSSDPGAADSEYDEIDNSVSMGTGGSVMLLRTYHKWKVYFPMLDDALGGDDGEFVLVSNHAFMNEPFGPGSGCAAGGTPPAGG